MKKKVSAQSSMDKFFDPDSVADLSQEIISSIDQTLSPRDDEETILFKSEDENKFRISINQSMLFGTDFAFGEPQMLIVDYYLIPVSATAATIQTLESKRNLKIQFQVQGSEPTNGDQVLVAVVGVLDIIFELPTSEIVSHVIEILNKRNLHLGPDHTCPAQYQVAIIDTEQMRSTGYGMNFKDLPHLPVLLPVNKEATSVYKI